MSNKTIKHEVKLQKSVIILLGFLAFGVCANVFASVFKVEEALAQSIDNRVGICYIDFPVCAKVIKTRDGGALLVKVVD